MEIYIYIYIYTYGIYEQHLGNACGIYREHKYIYIYRDSYRQRKYIRSIYIIYIYIYGIYKKSVRNMWEIYKEYIGSI